MMRIDRVLAYMDDALRPPRLASCVHLHTCQHTAILKQKAGGMKEYLLQQVGKQGAGIEGCGSCSM